MDRTLITQDRLDEIVRLCAQAPQVGWIVELGVYKGGSLATIAKNFPNRNIVGFDTFEGLPKEQWNDDEIHQPGDFNDTSYFEVKEFLISQGVHNVELLKGVFPAIGKHFDISSRNLTDRYIKKYSFVHVDFDFYEGIKAAIDFYYPKLEQGGIMVFDDLDWGNTPGVRRALEESGLKFQNTRAKYQGYIVKQ